jgi:hypothetical protein
MDDYSLTSLTESKNEWCARLVSLLTHHIVVGIESIFNEAVNICVNEDEENKYLMTFQNLLSTIPNWNPTIIEQERKRIESDSGCKYLEDLITTVHIIQLKALTCIRVGQKQKKIDINIPSLDKFIHNIYISVARKLYTNIYLYEKDLYPLQIQKNKHEVEILVKEAILSTIRDNIPVERILQCYMEENEEVEIPNEVPVESKENVLTTDIALDKPKIADIPVDISDNPIPSNLKLEKIAEDLKLSAEKPNLVDNSSIEIEKNILKEEKVELDLGEHLSASNNVPDIIESTEKLSIDFSNKDRVVESNGNETEVLAPKDIETLEKISEINNAKRKAEEQEEEDDKLNIGGDASLELDIVSL